MKFKALLDHWKENAGPAATDTAYSVRLPIADAARLHALAELFPGRTLEAIVTDLLHAGLDELEQSMPYERGSKVISQDDQGDPLYEDVGLTPRFMRLTREHKKKLQSALKNK
jgi:hypothetical protein